MGITKTKGANEASDMGLEDAKDVEEETNVGNNNKLYVIQVLEFDDGGKFLVYNRRGRVGIKGQDKIHDPYTSRESAIQEFEQNFLAKMRNAWCDRNNFVSHPRSYVWLEMDCIGRKKEYAVTKRLVHALRKKPIESKLEPQMVGALAKIEVATKLLKDDAEMEGDPLYAHYQRLNCELVPIDFSTEEFFRIENYMKNTHAETHSNYTVVY
ncbi:hypothetical protein RYX36_030529 [Vicia faba]